MSKLCDVCMVAKTPLVCDLCAKASCKSCSVFMDEDCFEMFQLLPDSIQHKTFCPQCYNEKIADEMVKYEDILSRAKDMDTYDISQSSETRLMRRLEKPVKVTGCEDQKEALMHLAFLAAEKGYNSLVDVNIKSEKLGKKSYIKKVWNGSAVPINLKK